jgi:molybdopterin synthase sulfur carrier subunit
MKIHVYAALKEYFQPEFELAGEVRDTDDLKARLLAINSQADVVLSTCRFAVEDGFIDPGFQLKGHNTVVIIPSGSGS